MSNAILDKLRSWYPEGNWDRYTADQVLEAYTLNDNVVGNRVLHLIHESCQESYAQLVLSNLRQVSKFNWQYFHSTWIRVSQFHDSLLNVLRIWSPSSDFDGIDSDTLVKTYPWIYLSAGMAAFNHMLDSRRDTYVKEFLEHIRSGKDIDWNAFHSSYL